ncbi:MAG: hypothetical protein KJ042_07115, partial [Deltaproteobacteria bacterium]|nr:hypothetical protein [Deltaproteobacteria bacterium]
NLRAYAKAGDRFAPIPFQIDERDAKGALVFPLGPRAGRDVDDGQLDANDELVFMAKDAGTAAGREAFPAGWKSALPLEIADPVNGSSSWIYLLAFDAPPAPSPIDYVRYDPATNTIHAANYTMAFDAKAPIGIGMLAVNAQGGGDGRNTIDRLKIRFTATTLAGLMKIERNEEQFTCKVVAWIDGPVRVIRHTQNRIVLLLNIPSPSAMLDNVYYANQFEFPTEVNVPFDPGTLISDPRFAVSTDALCGVSGMTYRNEKNPRPVAIDGVTSPEESAMDRSAYRWMVVTLPPPGRGAWLNRLTYDKGLGVTPNLFYVDRKDAPDAPENDPGQCGNLGYTLDGMGKLKKGVLRLNSIMVNIPEYSDGRIADYLNIFDRPLVAKAGRPLLP